MMDEYRRVVGVTQSEGSDGGLCTLTAVCDGGSVWRYADYNPNEEDSWYQLKPIPGTKADKER